MTGRPMSHDRAFLAGRTAAYKAKFEIQEARLDLDRVSAECTLVALRTPDHPPMYIAHLNGSEGMVCKFPREAPKGPTEGPVE